MKTRSLIPGQGEGFFYRRKKIIYMSISDSLSNLRSRISGERKEEDEIKTDEESLKAELNDILDNEEVVKEELNYSLKKSMNYYPQAINHTKEVLQELKDAEEKAEQIEELVEDVEKKVEKDENEISSDIDEIEEHIEALRDLETRLGDVFTGLEDELKQKDIGRHQVIDHIMEKLNEQHQLLQNAVNQNKVFQKNSNGLYPVMGHIYQLGKAVKSEEDEISRLREEFNNLEQELDHLETGEQHSVQLIKKEKSIQKTRDSESVRHTKEAIEKGDQDSLSVYSDESFAKVVEEEAGEIRDIEARTGNVADRINHLKEDFSRLENRDREFQESFRQIKTALENALKTSRDELEEAKKFEGMFLSAKEKLQQSKEKYEEHDLHGSKEYDKVNKQIELYETLHEDGREEEFNRLFHGENGIIPLLEKVEDVLETGLDEAEKVTE